MDAHGTPISQEIQDHPYPLLTQNPVDGMDGGWYWLFAGHERGGEFFFVMRIKNFPPPHHGNKRAPPDHPLTKE